MIDHLIITDVETGGLDPETDPCVEVAVAVWSVKHCSMITCFSSLIQSSSNEAEAINRIPAAALENAVTPKHVWGRVSTLLAVPGDAVFIAHRAEFDKSFYPKTIGDSLPWVCSKFDIEWPRSKPGASLVEVALAHDVAVAVNHRALADVLLLARCFERVAEVGGGFSAVHAMIARAMRPKKLYQAMVSFDDKDKAKAAGFGWEPATKMWTKKICPEDLEGLALDFKIRELKS